MDKAEEIKMLIDSADRYVPPMHVLQELLNKPLPASFIVRKPKVIKSAELVIDLIIKSVAEHSAITRDDIIILYWLYKTDCETKDMPATDDFFTGEGWKKVSMDKQTFINHWRMQRNAISWFKAALSSAILEGKLLVLPIIKI